jgi:hypothetical protein
MMNEAEMTEPIEPVASSPDTPPGDTGTPPAASGVAPPVTPPPHQDSPLKSAAAVIFTVLLVIVVFWGLQFLLAALGFGGG